MKVMEVKKERSGWRDEGISRRHRLWGVSCSATDIDFLLVEYIYNTPKAIIEYKNEHAPPQKLSASQYQVLKNSETERKYQFSRSDTQMIFQNSM